MSVDHVKIQHFSLRVWLLRDQSPHSRRAAAVYHESRRGGVICTERLCLTYLCCMVPGRSYLGLRDFHFCTLPEQKCETARLRSPQKTS